jgi:PPE-repeat protein
MATNFLGINTPAIMATEAHYSEMWAQDAAAMYGYAASSASAGILDPLTSPTTTANPAGLATTGTQTGLTQVISSLPNAVAGLASPAAAADPSGLLSSPFVANAINGAVNTTAWWVMNTIPNSVLLKHVVTGDPAVFLEAGAANAGLAGSPGSAGLAGARVLAGLGQASTVGRLSVPASWSAAAPAVSSGASALGGSGWAVAPEEAASGALVPAGVPSAAMAGRGYGYATPRYGFKPTVMPKMSLG